MNDHGMVWRTVCRVLVAAIALAGLGATGTAGAAGPSALRAAAQSSASAAAARSISTAHAARAGRASLVSRPAALGAAASLRHQAMASGSVIRGNAAAPRIPLTRTPRLRRVAVAPSTPRVIYRAPVVSARVSGVRPHISCPSDVWEGPPFLNRYDNFQDNGHGVCVLVSTTIHDTTLASLTLPAETNLMEANVTVASGNVVNIPTGASLQVSGGGSLVVEGTLNATGTAAQPVTMTSGGSPGSWGGVEFVPGSAGTLDHVRVSFAGKNVGVPTVGCCFQTAVFVDGANPAITNSTIDDSSNNGIEVFNSGDPTVTGDDLLNNANWALRYDFMPSTSFVNNGLSASGNGGGDAIDVAGGATNGLTVTTPGIPFRFEGSLTINPGAVFTIGAGTIVQDNGNGLITAEGTLNAVGTAASPISLTNTNPVTASWGGVAFVPGGGGTLNHVHLSFAGANDGVPTVGCCFRAAVFVDGAYPTITNSTIDVGNGNGVEVFGSGEPSVTNDTIVNNAGFPFKYDFTPSISLVNNGITASGNGSGDVIDIASGPITSTLTVGNPGLPLRLEGSITVNPGARFTINPGMLVQDNGNGQLVVQGTLNAVGTAASPISLTNTNPAPGSWGGIDFVSGGTGTVSFVHLSFAGANDGVPTIGCCFRTAIFVNGSNPTISNDTIDNSGGNGVEVYTSGNPSVTNDSIVNNGLYPLRYDATPSISLANNHISASGNASGDVVDIAGGTLTGALTLATPGLPVRLEGGLTINSGAQLTVGHGTIVQDNGNGQYVVFGTMIMSGTAASPISLTNTNPAAGSWGDLVFLSGSAATLNYVHLSFAGANVGVPTIGCCFRSEVFVDNATPTINNSVIDNSGGNDVEVRDGGLPVLHGDNFGAVPGGEFGVLNDSGAAGPNVDARDDWWGSASGPSGAGPGTGVPVSAGVTFTPFLGSAPGSHAPALARSRVSGVWKDTLTITGTNFGADEPINVYFDTLGSTPISSTSTGPGGSFVVTFVVPQAISGTHTISATGGISALHATTPFLIRPSTFLLHYQGNKGTVNVLKGTGFAPGETVVGYWNSLSGAPFTITAKTNSIGTFGGSASFPGITFTVPLSPTGTYKVFGVGQTSGGVAFSTFVLKPHLQVTPASGPAGSQVKVAATGYGANETVTIKYNCGTPGCSSTTVVATPTTDGNGFFSVLVTLPSPSGLGVHAIGGTGNTSGVFATANFTVTS